MCDSFAWAKNNETQKKEKEHAIRRRQKYFEITQMVEAQPPPATSYLLISPTEQDLDPFRQEH